MDVLFWVLLIVFIVISFRLILKLVGLGFKVLSSLVVTAIACLAVYFLGIVK